MNPRVDAPALSLKNFSYSELFSAAGLHRLDDAFKKYLSETNESLAHELTAYREQTLDLSQAKISEFLISLACQLEGFLAELFHIEDALAKQQALTLSHHPISAFKKYYLLRHAKKRLRQTDHPRPFQVLTEELQQSMKGSPLTSHDTELAIALYGMNLLQHPETQAAQIEKLIEWCVSALSTADGKAFTAGWVSFQLPERTDFANLVPAEYDQEKRLAYPANQLRLRDGFGLTDPRMTARQVQDEVNYCIYCHDHDGDFCSKGFPEKKGEPQLGLKRNPLDTLLTGCPLDEKISEMQRLKRDGKTLASLAMIMVDNPMCPATGHRICNDCMKACIYQKQDPVNIPQIETRVLTDVLDLPWGVEIYDLLTRWNPLRQQQYLMKPYNGLKVLIGGMGPAGFTLAHHLLLEGFAVVGFDGLKIEPLPETLIKNPIYRFTDLKEALDERLMAGFGGVAEYGITVRWDKNFLKLIYLSLMRRPHFQVFGSIRFGGTLTVADVWKLGFDHFALAVGAGLPKGLPIPNSMAPGMRQANDFLMALQLGNAAKKSSVSNLQVRLPAIIIGGGLTGVDTATEVQAYYINQIEKIHERFHHLASLLGQQAILDRLDPAAKEILNEFLQHAEIVLAERQVAARENRQPNLIKLLRQFGGATIVYRRTMQDSPAYINNHEELKKALEEGIYYLETLEPARVDLDKHGHVSALVCHERLKNADGQWVTTTTERCLPAKSILVATGTSPNTAYEFEHRGTFNRLNLQYQHYEQTNEGLVIAHGVSHCKDPQFGPFTSYQETDHRVSLIGDTHPVFHGNVVKAIASGLRTYPKITALFADKINRIGDLREYAAFASALRETFSAEIIATQKRSDNITEITIKAPLAIAPYQPGQFYRLQNLETLAKTLDGTLLQMEPLAVQVCAVDKHKQTITISVPHDSVSGKIASSLTVGEPVSFMGPAGVRAKVPHAKESILIIGDPSSFPFVRSFGTSVQQAGNQLIFIAILPQATDVYCKEELEAACTRIAWWLPEGDSLATRKQDLALTSPNDLLTTLESLKDILTLADIDRIFIFSDTSLLREVQHHQKDLIRSIFIKQPKIIASIYGNMQCMLKGVCAQCLQWQIDPETGKRTKAVFACSWQDQPIELVDIDHLDERNAQNSLHEKINRLWVEQLL